jgi:hypothetical protein
MAKRGCGSVTGDAALCPFRPRQVNLTMPPRPTTRKSSGRDGASRCREASRPGRGRAVPAFRARGSIVIDFGVIDFGFPYAHLLPTGRISRSEPGRDLGSP